MRVVPDWQEMSSVLKWTVAISSIIFFFGFLLLACNEEFYLGKTREELYREMFEVDSIMMRIVDVLYGLPFIIFIILLMVI